MACFSLRSTILVKKAFLCDPLNKGFGSGEIKGWSDEDRVERGEEWVFERVWLGR